MFIAVENVIQVRFIIAGFSIIFTGIERLKEENNECKIQLNGDYCSGRSAYNK